MNKSIRGLKEKDARRMFEGLNDKTNLKYLTLGYRDFSYDDCLSFINDDGSQNKHFAIVNDNDEWCGTVSLKNIDCKNKKAEYAIVTSKDIQGTGLAKKATLEVIEYAFNYLGLNKIFLNVVVENERAINFYLKCGFSYIGTSHNSVLLGERFYDLKWFEILKDE